MNATNATIIGANTVSIKLINSADKNPCLRLSNPLFEDFKLAKAKYISTT